MSDFKSMRTSVPARAVADLVSRQMQARRTPDQLMLSFNPDDDPDFHGIASRILKHSVEIYKAAKVHVVHIDNWFDAKWLDFSGKALGAYGV